MARVLIAGCGYIGIALGEELVREGHTVWGLRRHPELLPSSILAIKADLCSPQSLTTIPPALDFVFYTAAAERSDDASYQAVYVAGMRNLLDHLLATGHKVKRVFYTSSTAVYGQAHGEWVDETSETSPQGFAGLRLLEAEQLLVRGPFDATVVRMAGIYGPTRVRLINQVLRGEALCRVGEPRYTNRIHRDDCAGVLRHLMGLSSPEAVYVGTDHEPADQFEILRWLANRLGMPVPYAELPAASATGKIQSNKRCRNSRLLETGVMFRYPTFREGYEAILAGMEPRRG